MENFELSDCVYEHIKDTFYYGLFGDFKLVIDTKTGYFNATKLCVEGGKEYRIWSRSERSNKLFQYYEKLTVQLYGQLSYEVKLQNNDILNKQVTGTYVPKELILDIASWISIEFYDKCNNIIINYFVNEFKKMDKSKLKNKIKEVEEQMEKLTLEHEEVVKVKDDKIDELMVMVRSLGISIEEVKDQNHGLKHEVKKVQHKLGIAVEDRAPLPEDKSKRERFVLLKRNDDEYYPYYTIRAQDDYTKRKLKTEHKLFPQLEVLLDFKCSPNSKTLYTRIKENLKAKNVIFQGNNIDLSESTFTEDELVEEMTTINDSRKEV
jgi:hypothetical protein